MTTIDQLNDFVFHVLNKLNNTIVYYLNEEPIERIRDQRPQQTIERLREEINDSINEFENRINRNPPPITERINKELKEIQEELKEIDNFYKPRCNSIEKFLDNEEMKEKSYASFFYDKYLEHKNKESIISELSSFWQYGNITVDEIREEFKTL